MHKTGARQGAFCGRVWRHFRWLLLNSPTLTCEAPASLAQSPGVNREGSGGVGAGFDAQGVDVGFHEVANGFVDQAVFLDRTEVGEVARFDPHAEVTAPVASTGVAFMQMAFIDDLKLGRFKCLAEALPDFIHAFLVHGSTRLKGLTTTFW